MKNAISRIAILASIITLGACATVPGPFNGLGSDVMSMIVIYRTDDNPLTKAQYDAVGVVAKKMGIRIGWQLSSAFESGATAGVAYGVAGVAGGGTQSMYYHGASAGSAAGYTGIVYGLGGVVGGAMSASYANVYAVAQATEIALRDDEKAGMAIFNRVHAVAGLIRTKNTASNPAPELAKQMPDWKGPVAGAVQK